MIVVGVWSSYVYYRVIANGVHCKAKVVGNQIVSASKGKHGYALMVEFTYYNEDLQKNQQLTKRYSSKMYTSLKRINKQHGKELDILYNKERPDFVTSASRWVNVRNYLELMAITVFLGILPAIFGVFIIWG